MGRRKHVLWAGVPSRIICEDVPCRACTAMSPFSFVDVGKSSNKNLKSDIHLLLRLFTMQLATERMRTPAVVESLALANRSRNACCHKLVSGFQRVWPTTRRLTEILEL